MRTLILAMAALCCAACAPSVYYYHFDIADPGAKNITQPGERATFDDADAHYEVLVDPTSFQAILLTVTNNTEQPLGVGWNQISIVGPDRVQKLLRADENLGWIEPGTKVLSRLIPFELPALGAAAASYEGVTFELVVPLQVRGKPRDLRLHLVAHAVKL